MEQCKYPQFAQALRELAPTRADIAKKLAVSERSVYYYLAGRTIPHTRKLLPFPDLIEALSQDLHSLRTHL